MLKKIASIEEKLIPAWHYPVTILDLLNARGFPVESALQGSSLFLADSPFTHRRINPIQLSQLLENGQKLWRNDDFSFQLGHHLVKNGLGPLKELLYAATHLDQWVNWVSEFSTLICPFFSIRFYQINAQDYLFLFSSNYNQKISALQLRTTQVVFSHILKQCSQDWQAQFYFSEKIPKDIDLFYTHVAGKCHFSAPLNGFLIRQAKANNQPHPVKLSIQVAIDQCQEIIGSRVYLLSYLSNLLWHKQPLSLNDVARHLETSPATLKRKLASCQCSYQEFSDQLKSEQAVIELLLMGTSLEQISNNLNFHDSSNFRRAFKRWTGMTPSSLKHAYQELFG